MPRLGHWEEGVRRDPAGVPDGWLSDRREAVPRKGFDSGDMRAFEYQLRARNRLFHKAES